MFFLFSSMGKVDISKFFIAFVFALHAGFISVRGY